MSGHWSPVLLPSPLSVVRISLVGADGRKLDRACWVTIRRLLSGYVLGILLGLAVGLDLERFQLAEDTLGSMALGLQTLPSVCWVPLALLWFGQSEAAMLFVVVMGTHVVDRDRDRHGHADHPADLRARGADHGLGTACTSGSHVILPASLPYLVSGMKQGWAFAWRSLMAAEIFVTILSGFGLGHLLHYGRELNAMDQVIGIMVVIVMIGLLTDKILFLPWERFMHRRWGTGIKAE